MSKEQDFIRDKDYYDTVYNQGGISPYDNPYFGMTADDYEKQIIQARRADDQENMRNAIIAGNKHAEEVERERKEILNNMTQEERNEFLAKEQQQKQRAEYYSKMPQEKRPEAMQRDYLIKQHKMAQDAQKQKEKKEAKLKEEAIENARYRYRMMNPFMKMFNKNISKVNFNNMSIEQIDDLYSRKRR